MIHHQLLTYSAILFTIINYHQSQLNMLHEMHNSLKASKTYSVGEGLKLLGAGVAAIAFVGSGVGQGMAASKAIEAIGRNPESEAKVRTFFIVGAAITESGAIYGLVVAMILLFVV